MSFHLAQLNIGRLLHPLDHPRIKGFVYRSGHLERLLKRAEWFEKPKEAHYVLWWVPQGHIPSLEEARERLEHHRAHGATPHAFWFGKLFPAPAVSAAPV